MVVLDVDFMTDYPPDEGTAHIQQLIDLLKNNPQRSVAVVLATDIPHKEFLFVLQRAKVNNTYQQIINIDSF